MKLLCFFIAVISFPVGIVVGAEGARNQGRVIANCGPVPGQQLLDSTRKPDGSVTCRYILGGKR
ncbi:MAG: hypothetical protein ACXWG8_07745 [Usitatibacter sp.]